MPALIAYLILLFALLFFLIFMTIYTLFLIYSSIKGAPYVPTRKKVIEEILALAKIKKNKIFIELGSGDGRVVRRAVQKYGAEGLGIDVNPLLIIWGKILAKVEGTGEKIDFQVKNIFDADLRRGDYIYLFLMPSLIEKLTEKMNIELKHGAVVIAHGFPVKSWEKKLFYTLKRSPFPTYYYRI